MRGAARAAEATDHGGVVVSGDPSVQINGRKAVRVGDPHVCAQHGSGPVVLGNFTVLVGNMPLARDRDLCLCGGAGAPGSGGGSSGPSGEVNLDDWRSGKASAKGTTGKERAEAGGLGFKAGVEAEGPSGSVDVQVDPYTGSSPVRGKASAGRVRADAGYDGRYGGRQVIAEGEGPGIEASGPPPKRPGEIGFGGGQKSYAYAGEARAAASERVDVGYASGEGKIQVGKTIGKVPLPGDTPAGGWLYVDPATGEVRVGVWFPTKFVDVDIDLTVRPGPKKPPPSGAVPNFIAGGSPDVLVG